MPTRGTRARSRRVLFWALGLFLAVQLAAGFVLDYGWPLLRFPSAAKVLAALPEDAASVQVLFLGSSRFGVGIDADEIASLLKRERRLEQEPGVVNASVPCGDLIAAEWMLDQMLRRGVRPRLLVLEISPETLNHYNEWLGFHVVRQLRWEHVPGYWADACRAGHGMRFVSARLFPLLVHREQLLDLAGRLWQPPPASRRTPRSKTARGAVDWPELLRPPVAEVTPELRALIELTTEHQPRRWLRHYRIAGNSPAALERILALCRQREIQVVLIGVPVTTTHRETYDPVIEQAYQDYLAGLRQREMFIVYDCRDWLADGLYLDNHHLNPEGKLYFSRLLTHRVILPLWHER